jgi:hypothetical protein
MEAHKQRVNRNLLLDLLSNDTIGLAGVQMPIHITMLNFVPTHIDADTHITLPVPENFEIHLSPKKSKSEYQKMRARRAVKNLTGKSRVNSASSKYRKVKLVVHSRSTQTDDFFVEEVYKTQINNDANVMSRMETQLNEMISMMQDNTG